MNPNPPQQKQYRRKQAPTQNKPQRAPQNYRGTIKRMQQQMDRMYGGQFTAKNALEEFYMRPDHLRADLRPLNNVPQSALF